MKKLLVAAFPFLCLIQLHASMPEAYKHVDRMLWVVDDLDRVIQGWKSLGFSAFAEPQYQDELKGRACDARFGDAQISFLQPDSDNSVFAAFLKDNGPGVFSLMHRFANGGRHQAEIERLNQLGIGILAEITIAANHGKVRYTFMDTREKGRYVLGLISGADSDSSLASQAPFGGKFTQYAFAVKDPEPASSFWAGIGLPEFKITHSTGSDRDYYGKAAEFVMDLGWQRHGDVTYEWCIPLSGPTVYQDHIDKHGEGVQHIGLNVPDMDLAIKTWEATGFQVAQSGNWGEKGKPGSGRFAYVDTDRIGGIMVELLWNYRP